MLRLPSYNDDWKPSKPVMLVLIEGPRWALSDEYPSGRVSVISVFHYSVLAKLATSSIRVNLPKIVYKFKIVVGSKHFFKHVGIIPSAPSPCSIDLKRSTGPLRP